MTHAAPVLALVVALALHPSQVRDDRSDRPGATLVNPEQIRIHAKDRLGSTLLPLREIEHAITFEGQQCRVTWVRLPYWYHDHPEQVNLFHSSNGPGSGWSYAWAVTWADIITWWQAAKLPPGDPAALPDGDPHPYGRNDYRYICPEEL